MRATRPGFLVTAAGASLAATLVFGLPHLAAAPDEKTEEAERSAPPWLADALAEMKANSCPGVAIVVPPGAEARLALAKKIETLLEHGSYDARERLVEAVYVCVPAKWAAAEEGETAVLLDAEGRRVAGAKVSFDSAPLFVETIDTLLRADGRLTKRADAARTKEVAALLADLADKDENKANVAADALLTVFGRSGAAVIAARQATKSDAARQWLQNVVLWRFNERAGLALGPQVLPYGVEWTPKAEVAPDADPCPACGMAVVRRSSHAFLRFLTKGRPAK